MKSRFAALATLALFAAASPAIAEPAAPAAPKETTKEAPAPSVKEEDYAKTLLGSWRNEMNEGPATGHALTTYLEDGKATSSAHFKAGDKELKITAKAKWTLVKNKLTTEITESSMPEMMPVGTKIEQTIVSLSDKEFRYLQEGKEITEKRVKEEKPKAVPAK
jgi:hypothetical protein